MLTRELCTADEWRAAWPAFLTLRPHLQLGPFLAAREELLADGYRLFGSCEGEEVAAVLGLRKKRHVEHGWELVIEDLSTHAKLQGRGHARRLLDMVKELALREGCFRIKLDSGLQRARAHALYEAAGFDRSGYRFTLLSDSIPHV